MRLGAAGGFLIEPLFDTPRFARNLETAYTRMWEAYLGGEQPQMIDVVETSSLSELASKIGLEPAVLEHTVEEFNKAVREDVPFDATKLDGKSTNGIAPRKSNWAVRIDEPPFRAYTVTGGITFTFGGLQVNRKAQVLNTSIQPIQGLYASGDIVGLFFHNYPSCTGQTRNVVFSRIAGRNAVSGRGRGEGLERRGAVG